jgi:undecaprenyl diphosphate synthase
MKGKMALAEIKRNPEEPHSIEEWEVQIKATWENAPEFKVNPQKTKHVAVICDGNRRAANEIHLKPNLGHQAGVETIRGVARTLRKWGVKNSTFWVWSRENWKREKNDPQQVKFVMKLAYENLKDPNFLEELKENQVRFTQIGRKEKIYKLFNNKMGKIIEKLEEETKKFNSYQLNLAMDYIGLDEINRAYLKMNEDIGKGKLDPNLPKKRPKLIYNYLDTAGQPLVDLVIRTGMNIDEIPHTSDFMPLQARFACWQFLPDFFPNLTPYTLLETIEGFEKYERRFGR